MYPPTFKLFFLVKKYSPGKLTNFHVQVRFGTPNPNTCGFHNI